jgi:hypothetical protein
MDEKRHNILNNIMIITIFRQEFSFLLPASGGGILFKVSIQKSENQAGPLRGLSAGLASQSVTSEQIKNIRRCRKAEKTGDKKIYPDFHCAPHYLFFTLIQFRNTPSIQFALQTAT